MGEKKSVGYGSIKRIISRRTHFSRSFIWYVGSLIILQFFFVVSCNLNKGQTSVDGSGQAYSDGTTGVSVTGCETDTDCPQGYSCVNSKCVEVRRCQTDLDCPEGYSCGSNGRCIPFQSCQLDSDCPQGYTCSSGKCVESSEKELTQVGHQGKYYFISPTFDLSRFYSTPTRKNVSSGKLVQRWKAGPFRRVFLTVGDVNGDGKLEIVVNPIDDKNVKVYSSDGKLLYTITPSDVELLYVTLLWDLTEDGTPEIIAGLRDVSDNLKINVYSGKDGSLIKSLSYGQGENISGIMPSYVKGKMIISALLTGYYYGKCMPRGAAAIDYSTGSKVWEILYGDNFSYLAFSDIDGDGRVEIGGDSRSLLNGCSAGETTDDEIWAKVIKDDGTELFKVPVSSFYEGDSYIRGNLDIAFSDLDGDGSGEIIAFESHDSNFSGRNAIHLVDRTGRLIRTFFGEDNAGTWTFSIADINGDGFKEIICSGGNGQDVYVLKHDLTGYLNFAQDIGRVLGTNDIDGDGQVEIIVFDNMQNELKVLNPDLTEQWSWSFSGNIYSFAISDLDEDGVNEIILCPCKANDEYLYVLEPE